MIEMVIGTIIMLIGAAIAMFLILIAINIVLFLKLRSGTPQSPHAKPPAAGNFTPGSNNAKR
jgi:hypothetical protein